ncbi:PAAR domain-containing protein [Ideonella azotifigens]|uniref:PAAR domain-containing protein n=1 Tax=Ideonella azotifigens TaxID=513160 RepID=A0ABN1K0I5_9BURK|nr:PAAR domain-containing protein [Ideonella azotifigens]MCD2341538.1 PAAR domain-containing protein [Ideonella azotifigens]
MSKPFIVVGDKTNHGGVVIAGAPTTTTSGKAIARVGDQVSCPHRGHGGTTVIATGDPTCMIDGKPAARDGDTTACGATLIASQAVTTD